MSALRRLPDVPRRDRFQGRKTLNRAEASELAGVALSLNGDQSRNRCAQRFLDEIDEFYPEVADNG